MQRRSARNDNFRELLALSSQRRVLIDGMFHVRDVKQRRTEQLLVVLEVFRRILDEQTVARLQHDRRKLGEKQRLATLNFLDAQPISFRQHFRQRLAIGKTAFLDMQL